MSAWWVKILRHARPPTGRLVTVALLAFSVAAMDALKPWPLKLLIDRVLKPTGGEARGGIGLVIVLLSAMVALFIVAQLARIVQEYIQAGVGNRMAFSVGAELFEHVQQLSLLFHGRRTTGDLLRRIVRDSACARDLLIGVLVPIFSASASLLIMFAIMLRLDATLALISIFFALPLAIVVRMFTGRITDASYRRDELEGQVMSLAEQTLGALPIVQTFSREAQHDREYVDLSKKTFGAYIAAMVAELKFKIGTTAVTASGSAVVMIVGGMHVLDGRLAIGSLLVFLAYLTALYAPLETLAYISNGYAAAAAGAKRVLEILESDERVVEKPHAKMFVPRGVEVSFEGVTFGYEPDRPVLHDINFTARAGETIALVGATGAGKSTLVSLLPRLFDPWQGAVKFDGQDLRDLTLLSLREQVAIVPQEPFLLPLTIAQNIAYGKSDATFEDIQTAARAANADEFIEQLPGKYEKILNERGANLSVGQRQRIAIARAILKDSRVLILDEPTSALDIETEHALMDALRRLMLGRTCFVIAHRLSTIRNADRIIVIENGRIVECGTRDELLRDDKTFSRYSALQGLAT